MSKVLTFSTEFPSYHPRKGDYTYFVEKFLKSNRIEYNYCVHEHSLHSFWSLNRGKEKLVDDFISFKFSDPFDFEPKNHTIRAGKRFKEGDYFSPRIWSGRPYFSKTITIAPDTLIVKTYDFEIKEGGYIFIDNKIVQSWDYDVIAKNDGLSEDDLMAGSARFGELNPMFGKKQTEETKNKISEKNKGKKHTKETLENMSKAQKGRTHSEETKKKQSIARKEYWRLKKLNKNKTDGKN